mgnify:CR=1 FL=1
MAIGKFSEDLKSYQDYLFKNETVVANNTTASTVRQVGGTQASLEVVVVVGDTDIIIADAKALTISLKGSETEAGTFTDVASLYELTASGATTLKSGAELARYVVKPSDPLYGKLEVVNNDTALTGTVEAYIRAIYR